MESSRPPHTHTHMTHRWGQNSQGMSQRNKLLKNGQATGLLACHFNFWVLTLGPFLPGEWACGFWGSVFTVPTTDCLSVLPWVSAFGCLTARENWLRCGGDWRGRLGCILLHHSFMMARTFHGTCVLLHRVSDPRQEICLTTPTRDLIT